jgi:HEAT repeat protein
MKALYWKISTFASLGAAAFFALRAPSGAPHRPGSAAVEHGSTASSGAAGPAGWFGGLFATPAHADTIAKANPLSKLESARSARAQCDALNELAESTDEAATQAIIDFAGKTGHVKDCAISALGKSKSSAARSWLSDLLHDKDAQVRIAAVDALAAREDDPEARSILFDVAHDGTPEMRTRALVGLGNLHAAGAGPLLLDAVQAADPENQATLVSALGETHDPAALSVLSEVAKTGSQDAREAAIRSMGSLGGPEATQALSEIVRTGGAEETTTAIQALSQSDDPGAEKALLSAVTDPRPDVAQAALRSLGDRDGEDVRDVMSRALASSDPKMAGGAASYFAVHKDESAVTKLLEVAKRGNDASAEAVSALSAIGGDAARSALIDVASRPGGAQKYALRELAQDQTGKGDARRVALQLVSQGGEVASSALETLAADGSDEARDALVKAAGQGGPLAGRAVTALSRRGDPESMRALKDAASSKDENVRTQALYALGSSGKLEAAPVLAAAAHDKNASVRSSALMALAQLGGPDAQRAIAETAASSDASTRMLAVQALSQRPMPGSTGTLETLAKDHDADVARDALRALADAAPDRALPLVQDAMRSDNRASRLSALNAASSLESEPQTKILVAAVHDSDRMIVRNAARQLAQLGGPTAQSALTDLLMSSDATDETKRVAADALNDMGGEATQRFHDLISKYVPEPQSSDDEE